jgi:hypothetical protein
LKSNQIQALNYCAHAIDDLRILKDSFRRTMPQSAIVLHRLIGMLQQSVKFILPNCCDLLDPGEMRQAHLDLVRLPFPCVAFEIPWEKDGPVEAIGGIEQTAATKRIALCWEPRPEYEVLPGLNDILNAFPESGVFVVPIFWMPKFRIWNVGMGGAFLPYANVVEELALEDALPASRIANAALIEAGLAKPRGKQFRGEPFYLLPELFRTMIAEFGGEEQAFAQIMLDSRDELLVLIQACSVINCANVATDDIAPSMPLNKKREAKGKQPFFSYKVLQLKDEQRAADHNGLGGHYASPRMHLRRGHLRRLESKTVWVRPTIVNANSDIGVAAKDYAVHPKA